MSGPPLFAFGTLRDADVIELVLGRPRAQVRALAAWIEDRVALTLPGETYPVLAVRPAARADGLLLHLEPGDLDRVAFFEGEEYGFEPAQVRTGAGEPVPAQLCGERASRRGPRAPWSLQAWQREHKAHFLVAARHYMALYGRMSYAEADEEWHRLRART